MMPVEQVLADIRAIVTDDHDEDEGSGLARLMPHAFHADRTFTRQFNPCPERGG